MYFLKTEQSFDAAHFLKGHPGKCRNLHGHRWRVVAHLRSQTLSPLPQERGMVMDFSALKKQLGALCARLDHSLIYETGSLSPVTEDALRAEDFRLVALPFPPTAEELARYFYEELQAGQCAVERVEVYETPDNCAAFGG